MRFSIMRKSILILSISLLFTSILILSAKDSNSDESWQNNMPPEDEFNKDFYEGSTKLKNGAVVSFRLQLAAFNKKTYPHKDALSWGDSFELAVKGSRKFPENLIQTIIVAINSKEQAVNLSGYSNLMNVNFVRLDKHPKQGFVIEIWGGGAAKYIAKLHFDNTGYLIYRRVFSPSFPDEAYEETTYSYPRREDM